MANQMIALGIRAPQPIDIGGAASRYANMMANTAVVRERQNSIERANAFRQLVSSDQFDPANPQHIKAAQALDPEGAGKIAATYDKRQQDKQKYVGDFYDSSISVLANSRDPQDLQLRAEVLKSNFPEFAKNVDKTVNDMVNSPDGFEAERNRAIFRTQSAADQMGYTYPKAKAEVVYGPNGEVMEARVGGQKPGGVFQLEQFNLAPPRKGTVTVEDMPEPDNAPVMTAEAERFIASFPSEAQPAIRERVMRGDLGNIPMGNPAPAAGTRGGRGGPYEVIDQMPMRASSAQSGMVSNLGPEEGYVGTGRGAVGRNPMQAPAPGVYNVPTSTVAETSRATRPSKGEVFETELAKIKAARAAGPAPLTPQQKLARRTEVANAYTKTQTLMDKAYNPKEGIVALASKIKALSDDQKEAITGWSGYIPSYRETSKEADTLVGNLKGVVTALGKDAAAATGAIGPMAVQEWQIASDMIAKLNLEGMTPRALDAQMDRIINQVSRATNLAQRVYDVQYGDDVKQYPAFRLKGGSPPKAKTPVPKGGSMISPDIEKILKSRGL